MKQFIVNNYNGTLFISFGRSVTPKDYDEFKNLFCDDIDSTSLTIGDVTVGISDDGRMFIDDEENGMHYLGDYVMFEVDMDSFEFDLRYFNRGIPFLV